jgi:hypothetical protein
MATAWKFYVWWKYVMNHCCLIGSVPSSPIRLHFPHKQLLLRQILPDVLGVVTSSAEPSHFVCISSSLHLFKRKLSACTRHFIWRSRDGPIITVNTSLHCIVVGVVEFGHQRGWCEARGLHNGTHPWCRINIAIWPALQRVTGIWYCKGADLEHSRDFDPHLTLCWIIKPEAAIQQSPSIVLFGVCFSPRRKQMECQFLITHLSRWFCLQSWRRSDLLHLKET